MPEEMPASVFRTDGAHLHRFVDAHARLFVLTGAGVSAASGIPDYRDRNGAWKRAQPITLQAFTTDALARRRYWARSLVGWRRFGSAKPNAAHRALAALEAAGRIALLVTQNVDGLHQRAGSRNVLDLHGRLDAVRCLGCEARTPRADLQRALERSNPEWIALDALDAPDGDAELDGLPFERFRVPDCTACGGMLKPDVVFYGESVPRERVERAGRALAEADAMLVVGSSLMVYSGYRFALAAQRAGKPVAAVNIGRTRADDLLALSIDADCGDTLAALAVKLSA